MATASSHDEQRDMHKGILQQIQDQENIQSRVEYAISVMLETKASLATERVLRESAAIKLQQQISEVQLVQFLDHVRVTQMPDPVKSFQASIFMSKKRSARPSTRGPAFWLDDKIQRWNQSCTSSLVAVVGTRKMKFHLQAFCAQSVAMLRDTEIPVIWALKSIVCEGRTVDAVSSIDLIKYLISQAIAVNKSMHIDASLTPCLNSYIGARTENEWLMILASVLHGIPCLYIILDVEVLSQSLAGPTKDFWPSAFLRIFAELSARGSSTVIRAAVVSYGSPMRNNPSGPDYKDCIVTVGRTRQAKSFPKRLPRRSKGNAGETSNNMLDLALLPSSSSPRSGRGRHSKRAQTHG